MPTLNDMSDAQKLALILGLDANHIEADSLTVEPFGRTSWLVSWRGGAVLDREAAARFFSRE